MTAHDFKLPNEIRFNGHPKRRNNDLVAAMYAMYNTGKSLEHVGRAYGRTRQSIYSLFESRGYKLRTKQLAGLQVLDGIMFTLTKGGYMRGTFGGRRLMMHTYVWEKHCGKVPLGYGIRHKDLNRENNVLENLEIRTIEEISSKFNPHRNQFTSPKGSRIWRHLPGGEKRLARKKI